MYPEMNLRGALFSLVRNKREFSELGKSFADVIDLIGRMNGLF